MIKVENIDVWGFEHAIRGMRNPMNSWDKSDSYICTKELGCGIPGTVTACQFIQYCYQSCNSGDFVIGPNDLDLMRRLYDAGTEHRKYLRQIFVSMDITAPLYWWKEFDTYKVGTVSNSCSTMHKIAAKEFDINDFSHDYLEELKDDDYNYAWQDWIDRIRCLNYFRDKYNTTKDKRYWRMMIEKLPSSYNQKRTITMNYENVITIIKQRSGHKLDEWNELINIFISLHYIKDIIQ